MFLRKKVFSVKLIAVSIVFITLMTECSRFTKQTENATGNNPNNNVTNINQSSDISNSPSDTNTNSNTNTLSPNSNNTSKESPTQDDSSKTILLDIMELAKEGKVVNCEFPAKTTVIDDIERKWGKPAYDVKVNGEEIIGYVANNEFKLLLVFPESTNKNPNPLLDHYSVLYPRGTVNLMVDDQGRQW